LRVHIKKILAPIIAGLLLGMLILPQLALAEGPEISTPVVQDITSTSATIFWTTNTSSNSRVNYGTNTTLGYYVSDSTMVTTHFIHLTGLPPNTIYYFEVQSTDATGTATNNNSGAYYQFTTLPIPLTEYSITLEPICGVCGELVDVGVCGELIGVTAIVPVSGTFYICWDSRAESSVEATFTGMPGVWEVAFFLPESAMGIHTVYLTDTTYITRANTTFEVLPSVKIDPEKGPVGSNVTLNGYGFKASQNIRVTLFQGEVQKGEQKTATANTVGSWNVTYIIPATPAGGYTFKVEAKEGTGLWVNYVSKSFRVTPQITVDRDSATVGQTIRVDGTGFASDEEGIKVTFNGEVRKEKIYADGNGSWSTTITVPPLQSGRYIIDAWGASTRARDVPDVTFTVSPGILVEPISAYVGDNITVTGGGFAPQETGIKVYFDGKLVTSTTITANISGCWRTSFVLEASTSGNHIVSASGDITQPAVTNNFTTLTKIGQPSPVEGAPGDSITVTGNGFNANRKLTVYVGGIVAPGQDGESLDERTLTNGNVLVTFRVPKGSVAGKQMLTVTDDGGATASVNFTATTNVLATPQPISPETGSKLKSGEITFRWGGITSGSNITYTLQIGNSTNAASQPVRLYQDIQTLTYQLPKEDALPRGTYYWWVKAVDNYDNESHWSISSSFTVSPIPTWVWVVVGLVVLVGLMVVAYRETKFKVTE
jgi:hypothetical protein